MDNLDLDINNYNLDELLKLFKLDYHFTVEHLKLAKRRSLQMHPDKSKLDMKYFLFFRKAYEAVEKVFYFRSRRKAPTDFQDYEVDVDENNARLLHSLNGKSVNDFNSWFNKMFEKVKVGDNESDFGYEEWYRKKEVKENRKVPLSEFGQEFEKKKRECKSLVVHNEITEMSNNEGGYSLSRERPTEYSSDIFSKLGYEDLKKAHTETVVPVTREDKVKYFWRILIMKIKNNFRVLINLFNIVIIKIRRHYLSNNLENICNKEETMIIKYQCRELFHS